MKRQNSILRRGNLRIAAAILAIVGLAVMLNQPGPLPESAIPPTWMRTWTDSSVLRLNLPESGPEAMPSKLPAPAVVALAIHHETLPTHVATAAPRRDSQPAIYETPLAARPKLKIP